MTARSTVSNGMGGYPPISHHKQIVSLIDNLVRAEVSIRRHFQFHADVCGCGRTSACGALDAREYRGELERSKATREELYSLLGISPEARESAH